jgi:hypothetical protein
MGGEGMRGGAWEERDRKGTSKRGICGMINPPAESWHRTTVDRAMQREESKPEHKERESRNRGQRSRLREREGQ